MLLFSLVKEQNNPSMFSDEENLKKIVSFHQGPTNLMTLLKYPRFCMSANGFLSDKGLRVISVFSSK